MKQRLFLPLVVALLLLQGSSVRWEPSVQASQAITPQDILLQAQRNQRLGRSVQATADFQHLLQHYPQTPQAHQARYAIAESAFLRADWAASLSLLDDVLTRTDDPGLRARALMLQARTYESLGQHQQAIESYTLYEQQRGVLTSYSAIRRAAQLRVLGQLEAAATAYEQGAVGPLGAEQRAQAYEAATSIRDQLGQMEAALHNQEQILTFARQQSYRSELLLEVAERALERGQTQKAAAWLEKLLQEQPGSSQAAEALALLERLGLSLDPFSAGQTLFLQERYAEAISFFDQAVAVGHTQAGEARRLRALALRARGDYSGAEAALRALADEQPDSRLGRQARLDMIQTRGQSGDSVGAIEGYRNFAQIYPQDPLAPEALARVVILLERISDTAGANAARIELGQRFSRTTQGQEALREIARSAFQAGFKEQAAAAWRLLGESSLGFTRAEALYWAARLTNDTGDLAQAAQLLRAAYDADPDSYYGVRAADVLGIKETDGLQLGAPLGQAEREAGRLWISSWFTSTTSPLLELAAAPEVAVAQELEALFFASEAISAWTSAADQLQNSPAMLFELALLAHDAGNDRAAMRIIDTLVRQKPAAAGPLPTAVRRLLYPSPYAAAVVQHSARYGVAPHLIYAIMRQESLYNPSATSWVGARGLMQVMPTTGEGIAASLGIPDFSPDDLYDPARSIQFGAYYISDQIRTMDGSVQGALAAYNGGPGNAMRWAQGTTVADPDLFLMSIDYGETRHYVEAVYSFYGAYRRLYSF